YFPFLFPLVIGFTAAVSEEFLCRLFAISFFKKYFKHTFLALLIPAMIWAFAHSNYPVFPVYVRGIELTLAGLAFGWVFIRFGLWPCLVAHYAMNAILVCVPLLKSSNGYYIVSGAIIIFLALVPAIVALLARAKGKQPAEKQLINE
ncbi:MAG: CPBP family intramembrane glutamic endopeptidase, partial [Dehalococcoidia bacterium]